MSFEIKVTCDKCGKTSTTEGYHKQHDIFNTKTADVPRLLGMYEVTCGRHLCWECADGVFGKKG
jgi:hypothetical protein